MVVAGARISGVADVCDDLSLPHEISFGETIGVMCEVSVVKDQILVRVKLIDRDAAAFALEELDDLAICGSNYGSFGGCGDIDRVVYAAFGARIVEGVEQLFWSNSGNGNDEIHCADKIRRGWGWRFCWWQRCSDRDR